MANVLASTTHLWQIPVAGATCLLWTLSLIRYKYGEITHRIWSSGHNDGLAPNCANQKLVEIMYLAAASLLFGLLATAHVPNPLHHGPLSATPPPKDTEFLLAMNLSGYLAPLNAVWIETRGVLLRLADNREPGTLAYVNTSDSDEDYFPDAVVLDLTDAPDVGAPPGLYGLFVTDPGGSHGMVSYVYATIDEQQFEFSVGHGYVYHAMTAAPQSWFACTNAIEGVEGTYLTWGTYETNYSAPFGCQWTEVVQIFNDTEPRSLWSQPQPMEDYSNNSQEVQRRG